LRLVKQLKYLLCFSRSKPPIQKHLKSTNLWCRAPSRHLETIQ
uniref:Ovule protein n=1 Tax=Gongylonema pulchrum TaxID=637853 RepID=A0A183EZL0_9BILA